MKVPSENVKSVKALRERVANELANQHDDPIRTNVRTSTEFYSFNAQAFLEEAIDFSHLAQCNLGPSVLLNDTLNLLTKWLDVLRIPCKVKEHLSERLQCGIYETGIKLPQGLERTWEDVYSINRTERPLQCIHICTHVNSCKIDNQHTSCQTIYGQLWALSLVHQPR